MSQVNGTNLVPRVAICVPCFDVVRAEFAFSLTGLVFSSRIRPTLIRGSNSIVTVARDHCLANVETIEEMMSQQEGQQTRMDWIFFLDADMVVPPATIMRLLAHDKDIVGPTYVRRSPPFDVMVKTLDDQPIEVDGGLIEVAGLPTGCLLIRREVFDHFKKPIFRLTFDEARGVTYGEDVLFCETARSHGYSIWLDVDLTKEIGHIAEQPLYPETDRGTLRMKSLGSKENQLNA